MIKIKQYTKQPVFTSTTMLVLLITTELYIFGFMIYSFDKKVSHRIKNKLEDTVDSYSAWVHKMYNSNRYLNQLDDKRIDLQYAAVGIQNESSEMSSAVMKSIRLGKPMDRVNMLEESGDTFFYFMLWLSLNGFTLEDVMESNIAKIDHIYPGGKISMDNRNKDVELGIISNYVK